MIPNIDYYLYLYPNIDKEIVKIKEQTIVTVADKLDMKVTATITDMPISAPSTSDKIVDLLIVCEEIKEDAKLSINILETMKRCICEALQVSTDTTRIIITERYFKRHDLTTWTWGKVSFEAQKTTNSIHQDCYMFRNKVRKLFERYFKIE